MARTDMPTPTGRTPVTRGSSVPPWAALSAPRMSLAQVVTWCDVGPDGLSMMTTPSLRRSSTFRSPGTLPAPDLNAFFALTSVFVMSPLRLLDYDVCKFLRCHAPRVEP